MLCFQGVSSFLVKKSDTLPQSPFLMRGRVSDFEQETNYNKQLRAVASGPSPPLRRRADGKGRERENRQDVLRTFPLYRASS